MAVLAHPWTLKHPFPLIERLKDAGLDAIEVYKSDGKDAGTFSNPLHISSVFLFQQLSPCSWL
jgi:hypothetical protein